MTLLDSTGRAIALAPKPIAVGGEGAIHDVVNDPSRVAKVYKAPQAAERSAKLRAMAELASDSLLKVAAWPTGTLHQVAGGPVAGILMPKIAGAREVHHLYSVAQRKKDFPDADWRFLVHAARNCAIAFGEVHAAGHVVGDVNQKNVLVAPDATVRFVDCDSFQVRAPASKLFRCEVGVPEFTPPELQGRSFRDVDRTAEHDRFGLAVLIFHLLMMGRHPFSGIYGGAEDMPLEKAISTGRFAYSGSPHVTQMKPPPGTPPIGILGATLPQLFERSFAASVSTRPSSTEWRDALAAFSGQLGPCPLDGKHYFPRSLGACPWCQLVATVGVLFFLPGLAVIKARPDFRLVEIWPEVERWTAAEFQYARPAPVATRVARPIPAALRTPTPKPAPPATVTSAPIAERLAALGLMASFLLLGCAQTVALIGLFIFSFWLLILILTRSERLERRNHARDLPLRIWEDENQDWLAELARRAGWRDRARADLDRLEGQFQAEAKVALAGFTAVFGPLQAVRDRYIDETVRHQGKRRAILKDSRRSQKEQFLDSILIADHRVEGISSGRLSILRSFGIETALDINQLSKVKVPQIGPKLTERLEEWRDEQAKMFRFDDSLPSPAVQALDRTYHALINPWEAELAAGPARLGELVMRFRPRREAAMRQIQSAVDQLHQAELDVGIMERMPT